MQIGEQAKSELMDKGLHLNKAGTPTMGGLIVLSSLLIPSILWADMTNMFVAMAVLVTAWLGGVGFLDDYLKVIKNLCFLLHVCKQLIKTHRQIKYTRDSGLDVMDWSHALLS